MRYKHKNGWYAEETDGGLLIKQKTPRGTLYMPVTEQELIEFGFKKEEDKYEECFNEYEDELLKNNHNDTPYCKKCFMKILKEHFPLYDNQEDD